MRFQENLLGHLPEEAVKDAAKWTLMPAKVILDGVCLWPENNSLKKRISSFLIFVSVVFVMVGQIYHLYEIGADVFVAALLFAMFIGFTEIVSRIIILTYNRREISRLLSTIYYEFWPSNIAGEVCENQLKKISWFVVVYCCSYTVSAFLCMENLSLTRILSKKRGLPLFSTYPFDWWQSPLYEVLLIWHAFVSDAGIFIICGVDLFFVSLLWNCVAQFILLKTFAGNLYGQSAAVRKDDLLKCVRHHNKLIQSCKDIEETFSYYLLLSFLTNIGTICISCFIMTVVPNEKVTAATYFIGHFCQLFIYCYMGSLLIFESTELSEAIFHSGWHITRLNPYLKNLLLMPMLRAQKPLRLTAGKFAEVNLETFMKLVKLSFSVFTLLNSMMERAEREASQ